jgi:CBS domain-containing protein
VDAFVERHVLPAGTGVVALRSFDGAPAGLVTVAQLNRVPSERRRGEVRVAGVATGPGQAVTAGLDEDVADVVARLAERGQDHALVLDGGQVVGLFTLQDLGRAVELGRRRHAAPPVPVAGRDA